MNWMQNLYDTYNNCTGNVLIPDADELCPVGYSIQNAHVSIVLDSQGAFRRASLVPKEDAKTLIPVTEKSLTGRTSGVAPHVLCDSIQYCAGDYKEYGGLKESYFDQCEFIKTDFKPKDEERIDPLFLINEIKKGRKEPGVDRLKFDDCLSFLNDMLKETNTDTVSNLQERIHFNRKVLENTYPELCPVNTKSYLLQLERWAESSYCHPSVLAILKYVKQRKLVSDLIGQGILASSNSMLLVERKDSHDSNANDFAIMKLLQFDDKDGIKDQAKVFIRWIVEYPDELVPPTWKDETLFDAWQKYLDSLDSRKGFCYVTGLETVLAKKHPARLRNGKDSAKLISSNDTSGYTFLGRFTDAEQSVGISSEVTQKAHNALRWLIGRNQAFKRGEQAFVSWAISGVSIPDPGANTLDFLGQQDEVQINHTASIGDVGQAFSLSLSKKIAGYKANIHDSENIVVMGLDSATPGRMSITFYRELTGSEFLERIENWHSSFSWYQYFGKDIQFVGTAAPKDISLSAYGKKAEGKNGSKLLNATVERLLPCIIDGARFPNDVALNVIRRATKRTSFKKVKNGQKQLELEWEKCLGIACSVYKGTNKERGYMMAWEEDRINRDYLYGGLLAISEKIESVALEIAHEKRDTTAARFMQRFADRPFSTWKTIETALVPSKARINSKYPGLLAWYQELLDDIHAKFLYDEYNSDKVLSGEYLLGYHCQRKWLREHKRDKGVWIEKLETDQNDSDPVEER